MPIPEFINEFSYTRRRQKCRETFALQFEWYSVDFIEMCSHCLLNKRGLHLLCNSLFGHFSVALCVSICCSFNAFGYAFEFPYFDTQFSMSNVNRLSTDWILQWIQIYNLCGMRMLVCVYVIMNGTLFSFISNELSTSLIYPTVKLSTMSTLTILPQSNLCLGCCRHIQFE